MWPSLPAHPPSVCPLRSTTGIPCPLCGLTRAVVAAVHGDLAASLRYHPAGVAVALVAAALLLGGAPLGRRLLRLRPPVALVAGALALAWAYNLALNPTF